MSGGCHTPHAAAMLWLCPQICADMHVRFGWARPVRYRGGSQHSDTPALRVFAIQFLLHAVSAVHALYCCRRHVGSVRASSFSPWQYQADTSVHRRTCNLLCGACVSRPAFMIASCIAVLYTPVVTSCPASFSGVASPPQDWSPWTRTVVTALVELLSSCLMQASLAKVFDDPAMRPKVLIAPTTNRPNLALNTRDIEGAVVSRFGAARHTHDAMSPGVVREAVHDAWSLVCWLSLGLQLHRRVVAGPKSVSFLASTREGRRAGTAPLFACR